MRPPGTTPAAHPSAGPARAALVLAALSWIVVFPAGLAAPGLIRPDVAAGDSVPFVVAQGVLTVLPLLGAALALATAAGRDRRDVLPVVFAALLAQAAASAGRVMGWLQPDGIGLVVLQWAGELGLVLCGLALLSRARHSRRLDRTPETSPPF